MKFLHISDLHLGKVLYGYSMTEPREKTSIGDQPYWIEQFLKVCKETQADAVVIAGDVYDRGIPPKIAITLLDDFLVKLSSLNIPILMIAGNHDSGTRLSFGHKFFEQNKVYIAGEVKKEIEHVTVKGVTFWLVPYIFPAAVEEVLGVKGIKDYDEAMRALLKEQDIDFSKKNVIVSHQLVTDSGKELEEEGSEEMVGGVGNIDVSAYDGFDYVALGHIHAAQKVKYDHVRYAGSPLCYHFTETKRPVKGPVLVDINDTGVKTEVIEIKPLHPMREIRGDFNDIIEQEKNSEHTGEYLRVVLTDEHVPLGAKSQLDAVFERQNSYLMELSHEPKSTLSAVKEQSERRENVSMDELFFDFYKERHNDDEIDEKDKELIQMINEQVLHADEEEKVDAPSDKDIDAIIKFVLGK